MAKHATVTSNSTAGTTSRSADVPSGSRLLSSDIGTSKDLKSVKR